MKFSPFARQLYVAGSPLLAALSVAGAVLYPAVLLQQLKGPDSPIPLDFETATWIGSIHGLAGIPSIFMPTLMQWRGRKFAFITACVASIIGWILSYFAQSATVLLISESFHGFGSNSIYAVSSLSITEMMAPEHRDTFMQIYFVVLFAAMALNSLLAKYFHWKSISIIMSVPMLIAIVIALNWPESPYWLAYKRRFSKCEKSFNWLRGTDPVSKKELRELLHAQNENAHNQKRLQKFSITHIWITLTSRDFYVPVFHIFVFEYVVHGMGLLVFLIYCEDIFNGMSSNREVTAYGALTMGSVQAVGIFLGVFLSKLLKRKMLIIPCVVSASTFLILGALVSYLQEANILEKESLLGVFCLVIFMAFFSVGVIASAHPISSALMPVKHRGIGGALYVTNTCVLHTLALKAAPYLFLYIHLWGTFLIFAMNGLICAFIIWRYVPETKDRTLQDIENFYSCGKFVKVSDNNEECNLNPTLDRYIETQQLNIFPKEIE